jgi:hypothetical protein
MIGKIQSGGGSARSLRKSENRPALLVFGTSFSDTLTPVEAGSTVFYGSSFRNMQQVGIFSSIDEEAPTAIICADRSHV